jgi:hypothetical protein
VFITYIFLFLLSESAPVTVYYYGNILFEFCDFVWVSNAAASAAVKALIA